MNDGVPERAAVRTESPLDLLALAVDAFSEPLAVMDPDLRVILANRAARELIPDLARGNDAPLCCQLIHGLSIPCPDPEGVCALRQTVREDRGTTVRHQQRRADGETRVVEVTATPLHDPKGGFAGVLQIVRDVTESAKTEEVISRARNEWLATADSVPELIFLTDLERRIIRCNRAAMEFLRTGYRDLIGRELGEALGSISDDTAVLDLEHGEMRCDRPRATLEVARYAAQAEGRTYGTVWVMRDVTAVRRLESIATSVDMMNNLGHVLGTVRHELGNPVNAIKTALSVLRERFDSFSDEKKRAYLERCLDDVGRVQALLENLRTFNMFEAVRCETMDLVGFVRSIAGWVEEQLRNRKIVFELQLHARDGALVFADRRALQQVLLGLISNAADAVAERRRPRITLGIEEEANEIHLSVADNGAGISPADLNMVFLPLFTTKPQGTGLGLAIGRNLVARMNGTIELRSRVGRGTRVEIVLPRAVPPERPAGQARAPASPTA